MGANLVQGYTSLLGANLVQGYPQFYVFSQRHTQQFVRLVLVHWYIQVYVEANLVGR